MYDEATYWEARYSKGGNAGAGSDGDEADFKVAFIEGVMAHVDASSLLDIGAGDGLIHELIPRFPNVDYHAVDISQTAINKLSDAYDDRALVSFEVADASEGLHTSADVVLCIDVLFHQSTQEKFDAVIRNACYCAKRATVFATWNAGILDKHDKLAPHCFYRPFAAPDGYKVTLERLIPMNPVKTFYVVQRINSDASE